MNKLILLSAIATGLASLRRVTDDLLRAYQQLDGQAEVFFLTKDHAVVDEFWSQFEGSQRLSIVILHPEIYRSRFFIKLCQTLRPDDEITIHLYGDLLRWADIFSIAAAELKNKKVKLVVPSEAFKAHLQSFFNQAEILQVVPFPVFTDQKKLNSQEIQDFRRQLNADNKLMLLYTGRLSRQKNILQLIQFLKKTLIPGTFRAFFIGKIDDFEYANVGKNNPPGWLFQQLEAEKTDDLLFLEHLPEADLSSYYQAADQFISFSAYHDEDFGRSPVEAMLYGCPVILSCWGGYNDIHKKFPEATQKIPVTLQNNQLQLKTELVDLAKKNKLTPELKQSVRDFFSLENFLRNIQVVRQREAAPFAGVNERFHQLALFKKQFFYENGRINTERYFETYHRFGQLKTDPGNLILDWFTEEEREKNFYQIPQDEKHTFFYPDGKPEYFRLESLYSYKRDKIVLHLQNPSDFITVDSHTKGKKIFLLLTDKELMNVNQWKAGLPESVEIMTMQDILWSSELKEFELLETHFEPGSFFAHLFLSKGGGLVQEKLTPEQQAKIVSKKKLSRHHQMLIFSSRP